MAQFMLDMKAFAVVKDTLSKHDFASLFIQSTLGECIFKHMTSGAYDVNGVNHLSNMTLNNVHGFIETFNGFGVIEIFDFAQHFCQTFFNVGHLATIPAGKRGLDLQVEECLCDSARGGVDPNYKLKTGKSL